MDGSGWAPARWESCWTSADGGLEGQGFNAVPWSSPTGLESQPSVSRHTDPPFTPSQLHQGTCDHQQHHCILATHPPPEMSPFPEPLLSPSASQLQEEHKSPTGLVPGRSSPTHDVLTSLTPTSSSSSQQQQCLCQHPHQIHQDFGSLLLRCLGAQSHQEAPERWEPSPSAFLSQELRALESALPLAGAGKGSRKPEKLWLSQIHLPLSPGKQTLTVSSCFPFQFTSFVPALGSPHIVEKPNATYKEKTLACFSVYCSPA